MQAQSECQRSNVLFVACLIWAATALLAAAIVLTYSTLRNYDSGESCDELIGRIVGSADAGEQVRLAEEADELDCLP
jgi:hypothetical protein